ncbi:hypothetical protein DL769_002263 [Monosporascus sp. CRB-8-3]|nr:hypothetical protein DL769_002263 [Monosporascus sp. CRB-8-3]
MSYRTAEISARNEKPRYPKMDDHLHKAEPPSHNPYGPTFPTAKSTEDLGAETQGKGETLPATNDAGDLSVDMNEGGVPTA